MCVWREREKGGKAVRELSWDGGDVDVDVDVDV